MVHQRLLIFARTWRTSGSGGYKTHAHAALQYSNSALTFWETPVYSAFTHSCASVTKTNATSETCTSSRWTTANRYWWNTSSHHYATHTGSGWTSRDNILNQWYDCRTYIDGICKKISRPF